MALGMWKLVICLVILTPEKSYVRGCSETLPIVQTKSGTVRGSFLTSRLGRRFYSFRGIRYGQPPVGPLRFQPPKKHSWTGIFDATEDGPFCPQPYFNNTSEDCLRINVYTPRLREGRNCSKLPVIVFIHDGAFYLFGGLSSIRGPEYFMDHDVVLVTMNYRLGILGFLSTGDACCPGNNGMKDQILALKWVQKNIGAFNGDKNSVTLLGYSAGGWSITLHMVSPMAKGLFHRGVMMSGSGLGVLYPYRKDQIDVARKYSSLVGCPTDTTKNMANCLKKKSAKELVDAEVGFAVLLAIPLLIVYPVIERDFGQERYLTDQPETLITKNKFHKVPVICGRNHDEFAYLAFDVLTNKTATRMLNEDFEKYAPILSVYESGTPKSSRVSKAVKRFYLNNQPITQASLPGLANLLCDSIIGFRVNRLAELLSKYSGLPVYYYLVTYLGNISSFYQPGSNNTIPYGVTHEDELIYMLNDIAYPFFDKNYPVEARSVAKLTTLISNFAIYGNPTPTYDCLFNNTRWQTFNMCTQKYLDIGHTVLMKDHMFKERYEFWASLCPFPKCFN